MTTPSKDSPESALAGLNMFFAENGLPASLGQWAWQQLLNGASKDQIYLDLRDRPEYIARFPAIAELRKRGIGISESGYIAQENQYRSVAHAFGLPKGFYDSPDDFATLMKGDVSPEEYKNRVQTYSSAVLGDTQTLAELRRLYAEEGVPRSAESDLLAYYLDPSKAAPMLEEQLQAAQFASAASRSGYGSLSRSQAEQYGSRLDVSAQEAEKGFGALYQSRELFEALPGQQEQQVGQDVQLGAMFSGDAQAQETIEKRRAQRKAAGAGGGGFSQSRSGAAAGLTSNQV